MFYKTGKVGLDHDWTKKDTTKQVVIFPYLISEQYKIGSQIRLYFQNMLKIVILPSVKLSFQNFLLESFYK